jgi:prepilin-type N-terminal cleavage/methylation domain-containing protein
MNGPYPERRPNPIGKPPGSGLACQTGFTLVEMLIVLVITALLASALGYAFTAELTLQRHANAQRAFRDQTDSAQREITRLLQGARLSGDTNDQTTYFIGIADQNAGPLGSDRLTWTTTAPGVPMAAMADTDDFNSQQAARGPIGGLAEVSLGTNPVGDANGQTGLFERIQHPSDSDPTQGGFESLLDSQIASIGFQFWNGTQWLPTWDTTSGSRELPQAVEVRYTVPGGADSDIRSFIVPIPASGSPSDDSVSEPAAP